MRATKCSEKIPKKSIDNDEKSFMKRFGNPLEKKEKEQ
jgi:hypothetical protein